MLTATTVHLFILVVRVENRIICEKYEIHQSKLYNLINNMMSIIHFKNSCGIVRLKNIRIHRAFFFFPHKPDVTVTQ